MKYRYIAIEREYGSGGTEIGRRLSEKCGIACYGQEILEAVAEEMNVSIEDIQHHEENVSNSFLYTVFAIGQMQAGNGNLLADDGKLFVAEQEFIRKTAHQGSAIYLGHCASEALSGFDVLKIYIHCSDKKIKHTRIAEQYGIAEKDIEATRKRYDTKRSKYYYANTTKKWDDLSNYDIVLDSAKLGIDGCVDALAGLIKSAGETN